jgi:cysteine-rich repeat protein
LHALAGTSRAGDDAGMRIVLSSMLGLVASCGPIVAHTDEESSGSDPSSDGGTTPPSTSGDATEASSTAPGPTTSTSDGTDVTTASTLEPSTTSAESSGSATGLGICGDGILEPDEGCDDGNANDDDGCDADCVASAVASVDVGSTHTCVLTRAGGVRCWGQGNRGQLGYGNTDDIGDDESPASAGNVDVGGRAVAIAVGSSVTCAVLDNGALRCWGAGSNGLLGHGNPSSVGDDEAPSEAGDVPIGADVIAVSPAVRHVCALQVNAAVQCWGLGDGGVLGYGNEGAIGAGPPADVYGDVSIGGSIVQIVTGPDSTCALLDDEGVRCWGIASFGRLGYANDIDIGDDELPSSVDYVDVGGAVVELGAGAVHTCARLYDGTVRCWGSNQNGHLGLGYPTIVGDDEPPASVDVIDVGGAVTQLSVGHFHTCVLLEDASVRCWGRSPNGELGYGNEEAIGDDEVPSSVGTVEVGSRVTQVRAGMFHTCAVLDTGAVKCWGSGQYGELGYGNTIDIGDDESPAVAGDVEVF